MKVVIWMLTCSKIIMSPKINRIKHFFAFFAGLFLLIGCGGTHSVSAGKADEGRLAISSNAYSVVQVSLDGAEEISLKTIRKSKYTVRAHRKEVENSIAIPTGKHKIVVSTHDGQPLYEKWLFVSQAEYKIIEL